MATAKSSKNKKRDVAISRNLNRTRKRLLLIPTLALIVKLVIISRIPGQDWFNSSNGDLGANLRALIDGGGRPSGIWYGADAENYLLGLSGLLQEGFLSIQEKLSYWPAGYPLLLWPLIVIFKGAFFPVLAIMQSALYALACALFVDELMRTRISRFTWPVAVVLTFNPTIALNTLAIGYELPILSLTLLAMAAMLRNIRLERKGIFTPEALIASLSYLLISLMQPRFMVLAFVFFLLWALAQYPIRSAAAFVALSTAVVAIAPATMIWRNQQANGYPAISTNLGNTMGIGNGPNSTGGYSGNWAGIPCPEVENFNRPDQKDNARVRCVIKWQISNPVATAKLFWNKARFFWSPWFGNEANGTMARNPWRVHHLLNETAKTQSGYNLITGSFGKFIAWSWVILTLALMGAGFRFLWRAGSVERLLGTAALALVLLNWVSSIITIGDHRFRIPTMGLSLFLQAIGFSLLFIRGRSRLTGNSLNLTWPGLRWSRVDGGDILPSGTDK